MAATGVRSPPGDRRRLTRFLPWTDGTERPWSGWRRLPRAAPFVLGDLAASWLPFLPHAEPTPGNVVVDAERLRPFLYHIPGLSRDLVHDLGTLTTAP